MTSFLDKLKVKIEENESGKPEEQKSEDKNSGFLQLDVDIYQTSSEIVIVAPIPGVDIEDLDVNIENENDVVTIQGKVEMPKLSEDGTDVGKYLRQECQWGQFYRQIILPQEVNVAEIEARFKKGILMLRLPLLRLTTSGRKKISVDD